MGKLSRRIEELKSRGGRAPSRRKGTAGITKQRQPITEDPGWAVGPPSAPNAPTPLQNALFLALAALLILLLNAIFWGRGSDVPTIDPVTGRQITESEPWD